MIKYLILLGIIIGIIISFYYLEKRPPPLDEQLNAEINKNYDKKKSYIMKTYQENIDKLNTDNSNDIDNTKNKVNQELEEYKTNNKKSLDYIIGTYSNEVNSIKKNNDALLGAKIKTFNLSIQTFKNKTINDIITKQETRVKAVDNIIKDQFISDKTKITNVIDKHLDYFMNDRIYIDGDLNINGMLLVKKKDAMEYVATMSTNLSNKAYKNKQDLDKDLNDEVNKKLDTNGGTINNIDLPTKNLSGDRITSKTDAKFTNATVKNIKYKDWKASEKCSWAKKLKGPNIYKDYARHKAGCPEGTYAAGLSITNTGYLDGDMMLYCCKW